MSQLKNIPFLDLVTPHAELREELRTVFESVLDSGGFVGGPTVEAFEREFAAFCNAQHCIGVGSGTDALRFILIAAGVKNGDAVITVPNTFIATTEAISQAGAEPVFVDIDEQTYNMDPSKLEEYFESMCYMKQGSGEVTDKKTGKRVAAIIPVHLYGQTADMDRILDIAGRYGVMVVEDACQAHGAEYFSQKSNCWRRAGTMGIAAAFSFYPGKNLGACGEAGAVTTNDAALAQRVRMLRDHGQAKKYYHDVEGYNGRLDAIQAGILRVKLKYLESWNESRRDRAGKYNEILSPVSERVRLPYEPSWTKPVYHLYVVRVEERDSFQRFVGERGVGTGIHYPVPLHLQKAYAYLGYKSGAFPVAESVAEQIVSLPMFPGLGSAQQRQVAEAIEAYVAATHPAPLVLTAGAGGR